MMAQSVEELMKTEDAPNLKTELCIVFDLWQQVFNTSPFRVMDT